MLLGRARRTYRANDESCATLGLLTMAVVFSAGGYLVLLVRYLPLDVKASYMLQIFPPCAVLASAFLGEVRRRLPRVEQTLRILLVMSALHEMPILLTRYIWR